MFMTIASCSGLDCTNVPVIESLGYVMVMFLSYFFFKEKITKRKLLGMVIILVGIFIYHCWPVGQAVWWREGDPGYSPVTPYTICCTYTCGNWSLTYTIGFRLHRTLEMRRVVQDSDRHNLTRIYEAPQGVPYIADKLTYGRWAYKCGYSSCSNEYTSYSRTPFCSIAGFAVNDLSRVYLNLYSAVNNIYENLHILQVKLTWILHLQLKLYESLQKNQKRN